MKITKTLPYLISLLIISGMILHGLVPHHHHEFAGEVHACCESHHNNNSPSNSNSETPCNILSNIHFENNKPDIQVYFKDVNPNHTVYSNFVCEDCFTQHFADVDNRTPVFVPRANFSESEFSQSFSFRGPPAA